MAIDPPNKRLPEASFAPQNQHLSGEMFGRRKRDRDRDQDEPLVPHGMIWHATPESPSEEDKESLEKTVRYAEVIELMRRPVPPASEQKLQEKAEEKPEALNTQAPATPIPWWRMQQDESHVPSEPPRPILQSAPPPAATIPIRPAPSPLPQTMQPPSAIAKCQPTPARPVSYIDFARYRKAASLRAARGVAWLRTSSTNVWRITAAGFARLQQQASRLSHNVDWRSGWNRGRTSAQHAISTSAAFTRRYAAQSHSALLKISSRGMERSGRITATFRQTVSGRTKSFPVLVEQLQRKLPRLNGPGVRIVLTGLPLRIRIFFARKVTEWSPKHDGAPNDARLWTSMTLAAISAIIALIIVSIVPHYAARYLPSRVLATQSTVSANAAEPVPAPATLPAASVLKKASLTQREPISTKNSQTTTAAVKPASPPKARHRVDDDYVAPDTYKYYGNTSQ